MKTKLILLKVVAYLMYAFVAIGVVYGVVGSASVDASSLRDGFYKLLSIAVTGLLLDVVADIGTIVLDTRRLQGEMKAKPSSSAPWLAHSSRLGLEANIVRDCTLTMADGSTMRS